MVVLNQNVTLQNVQEMFVSIQRTTQTIFLWTKIMVVTAEFNSHGNGMKSEHFGAKVAQYPFNDLYMMLFLVYSRIAHIVYPNTSYFSSLIINVIYFDLQ